MRITPSRLVYSFVVTFLVVGFIKMLQYQSGTSNQDCANSQNSPGDQQRLDFLAGRVHKVLEILQSRHFLCYDSLWASLYNEGPRNWDKSVEFCIIGDELTRQDEGFVNRLFKTQDLILEYDHLDGSYWVKLSPEARHSGVPPVQPGSLDVSARLIQFQHSQSSPTVMRKIGLKRALLPEDCDNPLLECFPNRLALDPLPQIKYGSHSLPGPREGIEIQKYHYPDDWWLQRKIPPSCS